MEHPSNINSTNFFSNNVQNKSSKKQYKKIRKINTKISEYIKNPSISHFNIYSHFIYSEIDFLDYYKSSQNKNLIKLNKEELKFLNNKINEINLFTNLDKINEIIELDEDICEKIINFKPVNNTEDEITKFLKNKIQNSKNREDISCRKLSALYLKETGRFVCKSTIHKLLKNKLGLHYIKTCKKSNFLNTHKGVFSCLYFIKVLIKSLILGFELIFVDESTFKLNKSNFKCWRKYDEQIYFGKSNRDKINLIAAVSKNEIFYYEMKSENINSLIFLDFMKALNKKIKSQSDKKFLIVLDNCSSHKTEELIKFYSEEKINILFNVQYCSYFNSVELCFRALKKLLYYKFYEDKEELVKELKLIIDKDELKVTLYKNYRETLEEYLRFSENHKYDNANAFEIEIKNN